MNKNICLFSLEGTTLESILSSIRTQINHENESSKLQTVSEPIFNKSIEYCQSCYMQCDNKSHYQSAFHNFNLQLKMHHLPRVSIEEFHKLTEEEKSLMLEESDSSSSSDEDEIYIKNDPKIILITDQFKIKFYKALLLHGDYADQKIEDIEKLFTINKTCHFGIFMFRSGYFSAGIIENGKFLRHTSLRRYTTRRKQGGSQSKKDKTTGKAKSMGAQIRRNNEKILKEQIHDIFDDWSNDLNECSHIFICVTKNNQNLLVGDSPLLNKNDIRVKYVPMNTYRPTLDEVMRIYNSLTAINIEDREILNGEDDKVEDEKKIIEKEDDKREEKDIENGDIRIELKEEEEEEEEESIEKEESEIKEENMNMNEEDKVEVIIPENKTLISNQQKQKKNENKNKKKKKKKKMVMNRKDKDNNEDDENDDDDAILDEAIKHVEEMKNQIKLSQYTSYISNFLHLSELDLISRIECFSCDVCVTLESLKEMIDSGCSPNEIMSLLQQ